MTTHEFEIELKHYNSQYTLQIELSEPWRDSGEWRNSSNHYEVQSVSVERNGVPLNERRERVVLAHLGEDLIEKYIDAAIERAEG